jgi:hypothetical protein
LPKSRLGKLGFQGMNLAKILPLVFWMACALSPAWGTAVSKPSPQSAPQIPAPAQQQSPPAARPTSTQTPTPKPRKHKLKKPADANCASVPKTAASGTKPLTTNCPPPKTVVPNGGTSEPAVQITDTGDAAQAQQRSSTDQLLGSTEDNLKKLDGRQLTPTQQDMVSQIRQYMQQSKEAVTAGDTERSRMLAQKAQLLSDELVKP